MAQDIQPPFKDFLVELTNASTYPATFGAGGNAGVADATNASRRYPTWIQIVGAGAVVVKNEDDSSTTLNCVGGEVFEGTFKQVTSSSATRVRLGTSKAPAVTGAPALGVVPGTSVQAFANGGAKTAGFTAAVGNMYQLNPSGAAFTVAFPAISSANDGFPVALANINTGSTATVLTPVGSDSIGQTGGTGATAAGPAAGLTAVYYADNTNKKWLKF